MNIFKIKTYIFEIIHNLKQSVKREFMIKMLFLISRKLKNSCITTFFNIIIKCP